MNLTKTEKEQIKYLVRSPQWQAVERAAELYIEKIRNSSKIKNTQWETIKSLLKDEGKVEGIKDFLNELSKQE